MQKIKLTNGLECIVDVADFHALNAHSWMAIVPAPGRVYAGRFVTNQKKRELILLHRLLTPCCQSFEVDHRNGNTLDNRRQNLRVATKSQNQANRGIPKNNTSGFKGVHFDGSKYRAKVVCNKQVHRLGHFDTAEQAAIAYDQKAIELFGEFAKTNFSIESVTATYLKNFCHV